VRLYTLRRCVRQACRRVQRGLRCDYDANKDMLARTFTGSPTAGEEYMIIGFVCSSDMEQDTKMCGSMDDMLLGLHGTSGNKTGRG